MDSLSKLILCLILFTKSLNSAPPLGFLPNIIIFYADDLGYGDLEGFGNPVSITPNIDELIRTGTKLTAFYSSAPVCSPSRAALLTGRFQTRSGVYPQVFGQSSIGGLPLNETTIPEFLKMNGLNYATAIVGKWHLGISENGKYLPLHQGFDFFTGLPTVSDNPNPPYCFPDKRPCWPGTAIDPWVDICPDSNINETWDYQLAQSNPLKYQYVEARDRKSDDIQVTANGIPPNPLFWNNEIIQQPVNITNTPDFYTNACLNFISDAIKNHSQPFFLYMAYHQIHHPQFASSRFFNTTQRGMVGDALSEMDYNIGRIMNYLKQKNINKKTFVFFSSDNGPSFARETRGGNSGSLKCGKGTTYEGGMRVPGIAWMPGYIEAGRVTRGLGSQLDVLPTIADLVDKQLPNDRYYDGVSMYKWLFTKNGKSIRENIYYWPKDPNPKFGWQESLHAVRNKEWKLHWIVGGSHCNNDFSEPDCRGNATETILKTPELINLYHDVGEVYPVDVTQTYYKNIVKDLNKSWEFILNTKGIWGVSQINLGQNNSYAPCCSCDVSNNSWPNCCVCDKINSTWPAFNY
eukprot:496194_1